MIVLDCLQDMALAAVPAVGFGMLFNVPRAALWHCALLGAVGHGARFLLLRADVPIELATLIAAAAVSFLGVWEAQRFRAHPKVFTVAAVIPMIPGVTLFTTLITIQQIQQHGASEALLTQAFDAGLRAASIIAALAVGLAMPGLVFYRRRPVV